MTAAAPPAYVIELAIDISRLSPCRSKRGVVIFRGSDILSHGYNCKPRGFDCDGSAACKATCRTEAVHAEQHALLNAARPCHGADIVHVKTVDRSLVASGGPSCAQCSKLAIVCGVFGVWLYHDSGWRRYEMADFHRQSLAAQAGADNTDEFASGCTDPDFPAWWKQFGVNLESNDRMNAETRSFAAFCAGKARGKEPL